MHCQVIGRSNRCGLTAGLVLLSLITVIFFPGVSIDAFPPPDGEYASSGGDANGDGGVDIGDAIYLLNHLFASGDAPVPCPPSGPGCGNSGGDANGDSLVNIADTIWILAYLFEDGPDPASCPPSVPFEDENIPVGFSYIGPNLQGYEEFQHNATSIVFVKIPSGNFLMGSSAEQDAPFDPGADESPIHLVTLSTYLIAKMEISQQDYLQVTGGNPSAHVGDDLPVEQVSWNELNAPGGFLDLTGFSLPSEAQWEYACRGGTTGPFAGTEELDLMGAYLDNSNGETAPTGSFEPNGFGLLDMHGNVWEWIQDNYSATFYAEPCSSSLDPVNETGQVERVVRGGAYNSTATACRSANRYFQISLVLTNNSVGFRPVYLLH
ncbi:MAG: hypothetical protein CMJ95_02015 [Planctomycetes bacterium]|nr:hypothetical protein [Planctomycetota bacterium]